MRGYNGKIALVDLTTGVITTESLPESIYRNFIAGVGLGARILYERMRPKVDPLGSENMLGFVPGLLNGTPTPMATKYAVVTKSPLTHTWGEANSGGLWGPELKAAGYDAIFFKGISSKPVYVLIHDGNIELKDAVHLWGKETYETFETLQNEVSDKRLRIACIGPAGERCSLISSIVTDDGRVAGRSGVGAVMGAKKLKAVAVRGTSRPDMADSNEVERLRKETLAHLRDVDHLPFIKVMSGPGTCAGPLGLVPAGAAPIKNWSLIGQESFPDFAKIAGESITQYQLRKSGCGNCPINCSGIIHVKEGPYATKGRKPEYETIAAFGTMLLNSDVESIIKANDICDRYGMDTISTGSAMAFAMECYEDGLIGKRETGGIELTWGNSSAIIAMLEKIVRREGFGDVLADGVEKAAQRIGKGAEKFAMHIHGQEPGFHDPRFLPLRGLGYIVGAAPGRHMISMASIRLEAEGKIGAYPELQKPEGDNESHRRGKIHAVAGSYSQTFSDTGMCLFALTPSTQFPLVEFVRAVTGWDFSAAEAITTGKRILTLRQAFNNREGLTGTDFHLPERMSRPPTMGPFAGRLVDFDELKENFYSAMGWEAKTGIPSRQCLAELGLTELVGSK